MDRVTALIINGEIMETDENKPKVFRVYRKDYKSIPSYMSEIMTSECIVIATNADMAKGIAIDEYPSLLDNCSKRDIMVDQIELVVGRVLCSR